MVASNNTIEQVIKILCNYLDQEQVRALILDLHQNVSGNKSVMDTLAKLEEATR